MDKSSKQRVILIAVTIGILLSLNYAIYEKEALKREGSTFYLKLVPVDPRSLMQGDYMRLRYAVENEAYKATGEVRKRGFMVLSLDPSGVASFDRFHMDSALAENEVLVKYVHKRRRVEIKPDSFMFQEGNARYYTPAVYGVFKAPPPDRPGRPLLVGLAGEDMKIIDPGDGLTVPGQVNTPGR